MKSLAFFLVAAFSWSQTGAVAAPDFSRSSIAVSTETPMECDVVRFTIRLVNSGDVSADFANLEIEWPLMGFFLGVEGLDGAEIDEFSRKITATLKLPPGGEKIVHVDVLAPRDSGGDALSLSAYLAYHYTGSQWRDHRWLNIDTRLPDPALKAGGFGFPAAGVLFLLWIALTIGIWAGIRWGLRGPGAAAIALSIALGFWMIFAGMAWRDYQVLKVWPEAEASIVGRRDKAQSEKSTRRDANTGRTVSTEAVLVTPEFALRYQVNGRTIYSTGYDTGSSIHLGGRVTREAEMRDWVPGARIPCWYNPRDPHDVVVRPGFGGAYLFALFPLPVLAIGLAMLRRNRRLRK